MNATLRRKFFKARCRGKLGSAAGAYRRGLSLIELLISLSITAVLLTATMVAIDASFMAYASAAEQASMQASTRLVMHRLLTLVRTGTAHGPLGAADTSALVANEQIDIDGNMVTSNFIQLIDTRGRLVTLEYLAEQQRLDATTSELDESNPQTNPLISGVTNCVFTCERRQNNAGLWVLNRATVDLTVIPAEDTTTELDAGPGTAIRMIASATPRKLQ